MASESYVVAAIDIGTTYSGFAFSFLHDYQKDPTQISTKQWTAGMGNLLSLKTPTCILFNQDGKFNSFGYEAEEQITEKELDDPDEAKKWYFFERFKMTLYNNMKIPRGLLLTSTHGNTMPALKVFSASIKYLVDALMEQCNQQSTGITMQNITWIVTVPAIWSDTAKKFMREAAEMAGIEPTQLRLALEPEAAALYVRHIPFEKPKIGLASGFDENLSVEFESMPSMSMSNQTGIDMIEQREERTITKTTRHDFEPRDEEELSIGREQCNVSDKQKERTFSQSSGDRNTAHGQGMLLKITPGTKYMVVDAGGGTVDIAVHQLREDGKIREIFMANGGDWGGTKVDESFLEFLADVITPNPDDAVEEETIDGKRILEEFRRTNIDDDLELRRDFELKKRGIKKGMTSKITIRLPPSLEETFTKFDSKAGLKQVDKSKYQGKVHRTKDKIRIDPSIAFSFFEKPTSHMTEHLTQIFSQPQVEGTDTILMVGGFSESPLLVSAIREAFPEKDVVVPREAGLAVLKGAVIFGHDPDLFSERISKYTYGVRCEGPFDEKIHPEKFKYTDAAGVTWCHNLFDIHVTIGESIRVGEPQSIRPYLPSRFVKNGVFNFAVFCTRSEKPMFVNDSDVSKIGQVTITIPPENVDYEEEIIVSMTFSGTELEAVAEYPKTGQKEKSYMASID